MLKSEGVTQSNAIEVLNLMGLLSALMFTVAVAIPLSMDQSKHNQVLSHFSHVKPVNNTGNAAEYALALRRYIRMAHVPGMDGT